MRTIGINSAGNALSKKLSGRYAKNQTITSGVISTVINDSTGRPKSAIVQVTGGTSISVSIPYGSNIYPGISVSLTNDGSPSLASWRIASSPSASPITVGGVITNTGGSVIVNFDSIWVKDRGFIMAGGTENVFGDPSGPRIMINEYGLFGYAILFPEPVITITTIESDNLHVGDVLAGYQRPNHANLLISPEQGLIQFSVDEAPFLVINGSTGNRLEDYLWIGPSSGPQVGMGNMLGVAEFAMRDIDNRYVFLVRSDPMRVQIGAENDIGYLTWEDGNMDMSGSFSSADGRFRVDDTGVEFVDAPGSYWRLKPSADIFMRIVSEGTSNYNTFRVDENAGIAGYFKGGTIGMYSRSQTEGVGIMGFSSPYVEGGPPVIEGGEMVDYIKSIDPDMQDGLTAVHNGVSIYGLTQGGLALRLWAPGDPPGTGGGGRALWAVNEDAAKNAVTVSNTGGGPALVVEQGNVGIITTAPAATLDVLGTTRLGDHATNYAAFAADGELTLHGTARVNKEIRLEATITKKTGASAPVAALRQIGTTATMLAGVDQYSASAQKDSYFAIHIPFDCDTSVAATFHIAWLPGASWSSGNYMWKMEYVLKAENANHTTTASTPIQADVTPANATDFIETEFATGITVAVDSVLYCHLYRDVANDNGNDTGDLIFVELEYTANKLGEAT